MNSTELTKTDTTEGAPLLGKKLKRKLEWVLILAMIIGYVTVSLAQTNLNDINYGVKSDFEPTIKDAIKFADLPEIKDTIKRIDNVKYGITSTPLFPKYEAQPVSAAKMKNEPVSKLYNSLVKLGYGPFYNMPYGELWIANTRSRDMSYGAHLKHLSSTAHLKDVGYGGYSDNSVNVFGKKMYKKNTLKGDFNYERNLVHYYGYDTSINHIRDNNYTKQRYQLFEPKLQLTSHYTDSTHVNHDIKLAYYNLQNLNREAENNIKLNATASAFVFEKHEKLTVDFLTDFYNNKQSTDTINNLIMTLHPAISGNGEKFRYNVGVNVTLDNFRNVARFYYLPTAEASYNIYDNMITPYIGVDGGTVIKNSLRSMSRENPFIDTTVNYKNTHLKYNGFIGLKGNLSSNTSYDAKASYAHYDSLYYYVINYSGPNQLYNHFTTLYDNTDLLTLSGLLKYDFKERMSFFVKGSYYLYKPQKLTRAYHKPDFDLTFSGIYNLQSKILFRADIVVMGKQWALTQVTDASGITLQPKQLNGYVDANLEVEYRYTKMLSFFARFNNIANQRYYRWDRYPSQRFNCMLGLTFVPF